MEIRVNKYAFIIGIFIAIGLTAFILGVLVIGGEKKTFTNKFPLKVVFNDIGGLKEGNNIWFSGMKVGTVKRIDLKGYRIVEVTLNVEEKAHPFIYKDATAKIGSDGLLGNKIVIIEGGSASLGKIEAGSYIKMSALTDQEDLLATLSKSNNNLLAITSNILAITEKISKGEGSVGKLINDPTLALKLEHSATSIQKAAATTNSALANFQQFSSRLNTQGSSITNLLQDTLMFGQIKNSIVQLNNAVNRADQFSKNLETASLQLASGNNTLGVLLNDPKSAQDIKTMIENLREASINLNQDINAMQSHWLLRGFFKSKGVNKKS